VEFGLSSIVLLLILLGLIDFSRVFYFDTGLHGAAREGARHGSWFDTPTRNNKYLDMADIKLAVDQSLAGVSGVSPSVYAGTCPGTTDPNYNPPYTSGYPAAGVINQPNLWICLNDNPALDISGGGFPPGPGTGSATYRLMDLNVILLMNYGLATGFMQSQLGAAGGIHVAAYAHIFVQGKN